MRVAITTTEDRFDAVAASFRKHRFRPISLPCIRIRPERDDVLASVKAAASSVGDVMVSSARAVEILWPDDERVDADFYVVGRTTAAAVERRAGIVRIEGSAGLAELVRELVQLELRRLVFPHADGTDLESLEPLTSTGVDVLSSVVYRTERCPPADDEVDAVAFGSPSAVDGWLSTRPLDGLVVAAIGPTTAAALARLGVEVDVVAVRPGHAELAAALARFSHQNGRTR